MKRLTGIDATFLYMETASVQPYVASVAVFDPSTVPGGYSFEKVRDLVEDRLPLLPPFRCGSRTPTSTSTTTSAGGPSPRLVVTANWPNSRPTSSAGPLIGAVRC